MSRAKCIHDYQRKFPNGARVDVVIWQLPDTTDGRSHGFKYRLNYCLPDGSTLVRYDNERWKGDHKHIAGKQVPYKFKSIRQLLDNFRLDVLKQGGNL